MSKPSVKGEIAMGFLEKYPDLSKRGIADLLCDKHPLLFMNYETARSMVNYYTGSGGDVKRKKAANKSYFRTYKQVDYEDARQRSYNKK